ncbi:MAG: archaellin/type IV pilin N-terminal domain-containing protein [Candidatus Bathyarchaeia archaeon]|jgi:flagellin-like protein
MNYIQKIRKLQHNAKALSPVVASIILIAVTVAVSLAVAVWMGGLTTGFMQTEQLSVSTPSFEVATTGNNGYVNVTVRNTGTSAVTITGVSINNVGAGYNDTSPATPIAANGQALFVITPSASTPIIAGNNYQVTVTTSKNNQFSISAVPPF